jgi:uncharacterized protein
MAPKTFEQAAGFLRIMNGKIRWTLPPAPELSGGRSLGSNAAPPGSIIGDRAFLSRPTLADGRFGIPHRRRHRRVGETRRDPPRVQDRDLQEGIKEDRDLKPGMRLEASSPASGVRAFVDVGVHQDGLVHLRLSDRFVKDPREIVKAGDGQGASRKWTWRGSASRSLKSGAIDRSAGGSLRPRPPPGPRAATARRPAAISTSG